MAKARKELSAQDLRKAWNRYRKGDNVSDTELRRLIADTKVALDALIYRNDFGVAVRVLAQDLMSMEGYLSARTKQWPHGNL